MTTSEDADEQTGWSAPGASATDVLRLMRAQLAASSPVPTEDGAPGSDSTAAPLDRAALSPDVLTLMERWEAEHAGERLRPLRYVAAGPAAEQAAAVTPGDLPPPADLVGLAVTETVADAGRVEVRSRVLLAARAPAED
jgi:hypothetical protein